MTTVLDFRQIITSPEVPEGTTCVIEQPLTDASGAPITSGLSSCSLTLYRRAGGIAAILNGRSGQDVLNVNGGTLTADVLSLVLGPLDNVRATGARREAHVARIDYTWASGTKVGKKVLTFYVRDPDRP